MGIAKFLGAVLESGAKGLWGEAVVAAHVGLGLPECPRFHDLTLPGRDGTTQVDHLILSRFGVFVVETKNMGGWIFGKAWDRRWTQTFPNGRKYTFQNPLRQNHCHVKAVESLLAPLRVPAAAVRSVVAFAGEAEIRTELPANVTTAAGVVRHVRSFTRPVLSEGQVQAACAAVAAARLPRSWSTHRRHVEDLRRRRFGAAARQWKVQAR